MVEEWPFCTIAPSRESSDATGVAALSISTGDAGDSIEINPAVSLATEISVNGGDDDVVAGSGTDYVDGGAGNDTMDPGAGDDSLDAGPGEDDVRIGDGEPDFIACGDDSDTLIEDPIDESTDCDVIDFVSMVSYDVADRTYRITERGEAGGVVAIDANSRHASVKSTRLLWSRASHASIRARSSSSPLGTC